jgi:hypothetical protein
LTYSYCLAADRTAFQYSTPAVHVLLLLLWELQPCVHQLLQPVLADRQLQLGNSQGHVGQVLRLCTPEHLTRTLQEQLYTCHIRRPAAAAAAVFTTGVLEGGQAPQDVGNLPCAC